MHLITFGHNSRNVVLIKKVWERIQKIDILKQLQTHFNAQREKGVGTPFPRVPAPLHPCATDNQFGFKPKHGTDMCVSLRKQTVSYYVSKDNPVFSAFVDASKVFDKTNHNLLFAKLIKYLCAQ